MSKIAVVADGSEARAKVVGLVHEVTGQSVATIASSIRHGLPIAEYLLFEDDHGEVATRLRRLSAGLPRAGVPVRVYELDESESLGSLRDRSAAEISVETLNAILDQHERELELQRGLSAQGQ